MGKHQQELLVPDLIRTGARDFGFIQDFATLFPYYKRVDGNAIEVDYMVMDDSQKRLADILRVDQCMLTMVLNYGEFLRKGLSYIYSESLTQALSKTSMDYSSKYLPTEFVGYFELRGVPDIYEDYAPLGFLVQIRMFDAENPKLYVSTVARSRSTKKLDVFYLNILIYRNQPITETLKDPIFNKSNGVNYDYLPPLLNAIIFAVNHDDSAVCLNEFSGSKKAIETQKKIFTSLPFKYFHREFKTNLDATVVSGHFRWQPHGEGRKKLKLIYIEPHVREYLKESEV